MVAGLISDTHGLMRAEALDGLRGSDLILHAGDVGPGDILEQLRRIAPVIAVRGNIDKMAELPETAIAAVGESRIYLLHDVHALDLDPATAGLQIVVSGHSHQPQATTRAGVLFINPGSAGPRRFRLPVTVAKIDLNHKPWKVEWIDLEMKKSLS